MCIRDRDSYVNDILLSSSAAVQRYFDQQYIKEIVHQHRSGRQHYLRQIYLLLSFELWHRQFIEAPVASTVECGVQSYN